MRPPEKEKAAPGQGGGSADLLVNDAKRSEEESNPRSNRTQADAAVLFEEVRQ